VQLPCVYIVVSRATTGFFECRASLTSSETLKKELFERSRLLAVAAPKKERCPKIGLPKALETNPIL
jgi:hypothetical protein